MTMTDQEHGRLFEQNRPRLFAIAYRMLGTRADAEDMVQETYLRWHQADAAAIQSPQAWMTTVMTRLCIDRLRGAASQREVYPGEWLPEPLVEVDEQPDHATELAESLSIAFLLILERLSPDERAVLLLRDVFGEGHEEIARMLGRSEANCRQLLHRARERVRRERPRFSVDRGAHQRLVERFKCALVTGDASELMQLFAEDATWTADGGGQTPAAPHPVRGRARIVQLLTGLLRKNGDQLRYTILPINGAPGLVIASAGQIIGTVCIDTNGTAITAAWAMVNPRKLSGIALPDEMAGGSRIQ